MYLQSIIIFHVCDTSGNVHLPPWTDEWRARGRGRGGRGPGHRRRHAGELSLVETSAVKRSIGSTSGFHNHREGPY